MPANFFFLSVPTLTLSRAAALSRRLLGESTDYDRDNFSTLCDSQFPRVHARTGQLRARYHYDWRAIVAFIVLFERERTCTSIFSIAEGTFERVRLNFDRKNYEQFFPYCRDKKARKAFIFFIYFFHNRDTLFVSLKFCFAQENVQVK